MAIKLILLVLLTYFTYPGLNAAVVTLSGNPSPLVIARATAGQEPAKVIDTSTTCSIRVSNQRTVSLIASLTSPMNAYTTLKINLSTPCRGSSNPSVILDCTPKMLIEGITEGFYENLIITYEYSATVAAGVIPLGCKTIILTVLENEAPFN